MHKLIKTVLRMAPATAVAAACLLTVPGASAATPKLLVHRPQITSIDANSRSLVWRAYSAPWSGGPGCNTVIRRLHWGSPKVSAIFRCDPRKPSGDAGEMAMGSSTVVFSRMFLEGQGCCDTEFRTQLRTVATPAIDSSFHHFGCSGKDILGLAAHADTAVYGKLEWTSTYCPGNPSTGTETLTGGQVFTLALASGRTQALAGAPPAGLLGVSPTRMALAPYDLSSPPVNRLPGTLPEIQIWNLATRSQERTIHETGEIDALQIRGDQIAALVDRAGAFHIDRFAASTGDALGSRPISGPAAPLLALYRQWVVYVVGKKIVALNTNTHRVHVIARPSYRPTQLLAVQGQAVWLARGDRILSVPLG